jgi:hypothetical protein
LTAERQTHIYANARIILREEPWLDASPCVHHCFSRGYCVCKSIVSTCCIVSCSDSSSSAIIYLCCCKVLWGRMCSRSVESQLSHSAESASSPFFSAPANQRPVTRGSPLALIGFILLSKHPIAVEKAQYKQKVRPASQEVTMPVTMVIEMTQVVGERRRKARQSLMCTSCRTNTPLQVITHRRGPRSHRGAPQAWTPRHRSGRGRMSIATTVR